MNPPRVHEAHRPELEIRLLVCQTGRSRVPSRTIERQTEGPRRHDEDTAAAMHRIRQDAVDMRPCLPRGDARGVARRVLARSWAAKKRTAGGVTDAASDGMYATAPDAGARAGRISGAGGGGFPMPPAPPERRPALAQRLAAGGLTLLRRRLTDAGAESGMVRP